MSTTRHAMIMAGGAGTRLWPMSRAGLPKQLLPFIQRPGDDRARSLLELAAARLEGLVPAERRLICTGEAYRAPIRAALPAFADAQILGEPVGRDTVNAVGLTAAVLAKGDPDAIFAVLTADHIIEPVATFQRLMDLGFRLVEQDPTRLVTFSIKPTFPATGFGYVERGSPLALPPGASAGDKGLAYRVQRFVEKPDLPRAQAYVESGQFGWNSGMFVFAARTVLDCLERWKPECHAGLMKIQGAWGTPDQARVLGEVYPTLPKTSVDYALMEPASRATPADGVSVATVLMDLTWLDVGSWPAFAQTLTPGKDNNRASGAALAAVASTGNLAVSSQPGHTIALLGCKDLIVIHTPDATLVMPAAQAERLKDLHTIVPDALK
ncbi:MAG: mannose-1-phosphate guanylyltransferase [Phycisphaerales bacterium]|nr:mannose-1-phosphate guanylyltransferase [Phycisphaerales bacterium]